MFRDYAYSSVTRRSMIDRPEFRQKMMINGIDVAQLYLDTLTLGAKGYTVYRTVPSYPPVDHEIDVAMQTRHLRRAERQGIDGAVAAQRVDPIEARRREALTVAGGEDRAWLGSRATPLVPLGPGAGAARAGRRHAGAGVLFVHHQPHAADAGQSRHGVSTSPIRWAITGRSSAPRSSGARSGCKSNFPSSASPRSSLPAWGLALVARPAVALPGSAAHRIPGADGAAADRRGDHLEESSTRRTSARCIICLPGSACRSIR